VYEIFKKERWSLKNCFQNSLRQYREQGVPKVRTALEKLTHIRYEAGFNSPVPRVRNVTVTSEKIRTSKLIHSKTLRIVVLFREF